MQRFFTKFKYRNLAFFSIVATLLFALIFVLVLNNNYTKSDNRVTDGYHIVYTMQKETIEDDNAPQGIVNKYTTVIDDFHTNANCLAFYVIHQYVRVYIDDKLVYEFYPNKESTIGNTIGCTWVIVPLTYDDNNKEFTIELTPVFKDGIEQEIRFYHGAQYDIFIDILVNDFIWFITSLLSCIVGLILIFSYLYSKYNHKAINNSLVYLGLVAILISLWKVFDINSATLLFEGNPRLVFYISYSALILIPLPLIRYVESLLKNNKSAAIGVVFTLYFYTVVAFLLLQFFPFFDLRANISLILGVIVVVILSLLVIVIFEGDFSNTKKNNMKDFLPLFLVVLSIGGILDIIIYFATGTTDDLVFSFIAFFIYTLIITLYSLSENDKRNYRDFQTGLYNSNSCKEFIQDNPYMPNCAVMMIDLNGLKHTNDHYGHAAGDRLILDLTGILKKALPMNDFVGRYGGDEFIAIIGNCDKDKIEKIIENLEYYKDECNQDRMPKLSFAYGYALSSEHDVELEELLKIADEKMYNKKEEHYKKI